MLPSPYVHLLLCLQNLCHWKICLFVIPSKIYVTLSSKPMFFCLTQKPHPVRRPPLCRRGAGGEAVPRKRENQINTLVLKDINFTINIIDCLITERLIPWINLKCPRSKSLPKPLFIFAVKEKEGLGKAFFSNLLLVHSLLYSPSSLVLSLALSS